MANQYLLYWKPETASFNLNIGGMLNHAASEQLKKISVGDSVWVVTVENGELFLLGRIRVGYVLTQNEAERKLGTKEIWPATWHIVAKEGTEQEIDVVSLSVIAHLLCFKTKGTSNHLTLKGRKVNPQQLQSMRELSDETAIFLERCWDIDGAV